MTLEERINIIENKAIHDKEIASIAKEQKRQEMSDAVKRMSELNQRIQDLIILANKCIECGITFPSNMDTKRYGYGNGDYSFCADGIYHHVGFISIKNQFSYIGICNGGCCGIYDFYTNGEKMFLVREDDHTTKPAELRYLKKFLGEFEQFETAFYRWIDSLNAE